MNERLRQLVPQPFVAVLMSCFALATLVGAWTQLPVTPFTDADLPVAVVTVLLSATVVIAYRYPIHLRYHTKVSMYSVPLYLLAVLAHPALAAAAAGVAVLTAELLVRTQRGNLPSDIATATSRRIIVTFLGAWVAHLPAATVVGQELILLGAALALFFGDLVTLALEAAPICGETPLHVIIATAREGSVVEGIQYLLGLLGAFAAHQSLWTLVLLVIPLGLMYRSFKHAKELQVGTRHLLESMADTVDLRDSYTGGHSRRVAALSAAILRELNISGPEVDLIIASARVHDIGKIAIPDQILHKPDRLTSDELAVMQSHASRGAEFLARYPDFARGVEIVRHHHESWDGTGYPSGLKGYAIPFGARVIAVADSFDAMTSDRPYRAGMTVERAVQILRRESGKQWDAKIVDAFLRSIGTQLEHPAVARQTPTHVVEARPLSGLGH
jgi:HD-GYP domain-containing protein (c-di-GMP phosphodiesterase class II)